MSNDYSGNNKQKILYVRNIDRTEDGHLQVNDILNLIPCEGENFWNTADKIASFISKKDEQIQQINSNCDTSDEDESLDAININSSGGGDFLLAYNSENKLVGFVAYLIPLRPKDTVRIVDIQIAQGHDQEIYDQAFHEESQGKTVPYKDKNDIRHYLLNSISGMYQDKHKINFSHIEYNTASKLVPSDLQEKVIMPYPEFYGCDVLKKLEEITKVKWIPAKIDDLNLTDNTKHKWPDPNMLPQSADDLSDWAFVTCGNIENPLTSYKKLKKHFDLQDIYQDLPPPMDQKNGPVALPVESIVTKLEFEEHSPCELKEVVIQEEPNQWLSKAHRKSSDDGRGLN